MRRACRNDLGRINTRCVFRDLLDQSIGENVLRDRDGHGAAESVEEDGDGVPRRHVFFTEHDLNCDEGDLDASTGAEPSQDLVADPHSR